MEATRAAGKSGSRLGFPGHDARVREGVATKCGARTGAGGKRKADPQGLALILILRWCTLAGMMGKGGGGVARCSFFPRWRRSRERAHSCKRSAQRRRCDGAAGVAKPEEPSATAHGRSEGVRD